MKTVLLCGLLLVLFFGARGQTAPPEWIKYTSGGYLADIQSDRNDRNLSETEFKNYLLDIARTNLARQIRTHIQEVAQMDKNSIDGRTSIVYSSATRFSTDVDLKLVETKTSHDPQTGIYHAIAYIDKEAARNYYKNAMTIASGRIDNSVELARSLIAAGFKTKARQELEKATDSFASVDESLFWMNIFGTPESELDAWQSRFSRQEQLVKRMLSELAYGTRIYLACQADLFGVPYPTLQNELKGALASENCSFTEDKASADWIITVNCYSREHTHVVVGATHTWFAYVDAVVTIDKAATSRRIFEDEFSVKGGHTHNYREAARSAYKEVKTRISDVLKQHTKD